MTTQSIPKAIGLTLLTGIFGTLVSAGTKFLIGYLSVHVIISVQYAVGLVICLPILLRQGKAGFATRRPGLHLVRGLSGLIAFYAFYIAIANIPLVEATLLRNSAPLCVPFIVFAWMGIRIPKLRWLPLGIGFLGVLFILRPTPGNISYWHLIGFCSAIFLALSMVCTRLLVTTESNAVIVFYYFGIALLISLPLAITHWRPAPWYVWPTLLAVGTGLYIAMQLYTLSFRYAKPSAIAPVSYFGVVFAGFWGWLFWDQLPAIWTYAGIALVVHALFGVARALGVALGAAPAIPWSATTLATPLLTAALAPLLQELVDVLDRRFLGRSLLVPASAGIARRVSKR